MFCNLFKYIFGGAICSSVILSLLTSISAARAQTADAWQPEKSVTLIVPSNPGGGWDQTARFMQRAIGANNLSPASVEVINRGGAGGTIGLTELVERFATDPYNCLLYTSPSPRDYAASRMPSSA